MVHKYMNSKTNCTHSPLTYFVYVCSRNLYVHENSWYSTPWLFTPLQSETLILEDAKSESTVIAINVVNNAIGILYVDGIENTIKTLFLILLLLSFFWEEAENPFSYFNRSLVGLTAIN